MVWFLRALRIAAALGTSIVRPLPARSRQDSPAETLRATRALSLGSRLSDPANLAGRYFSGQLLELVVYNRSLSDAELQGVEAGKQAGERKVDQMPSAVDRCVSYESLSDELGYS